MKKSSRWLLWIGLFGVVAAVGLGWGMTRKQERTFFTAKAERGDVISVVQATGTINAFHSVLVGSQVSGNIIALYADFNTKVKKNQVVARIEQSLFQAAVDQAKADWQNAVANERSSEVQVTVARADVASNKANWQKTKAQVLQSKLALARSKDLTQQGINSQQQLEVDQATYDTNASLVDAAEAVYQESQAKMESQVAMVDQAKAMVAQKKAALDAAQVNLDHTTIYAPVNGTVVARSVDVGQTVAASMQAPTLFTIAEDLTRMQVNVATDESDVGNLKVGGDASFKVDAFPKDTFHGKIREVRMNATTVQNVVTYDTVIDFANPDLKLLPGMTAYITIPIAEAHDVVKLPNGAVRFRPDIPDDERKAAMEKAGIADASGKNRGMAAAGAAPDAGASAARGGAAPAGGGARGGAGGGRSGGGAPADPLAGIVKPKRGDIETHIIWKMVGEKQMEPVQIKTSITDYTYTAVVEILKGSLKEGDTVVTGMSIPNRAATGAFGPGQPGGRGGFGGPGGGRGR